MDVKFASAAVYRRFCCAKMPRVSGRWTGGRRYEDAEAKTVLDVAAGYGAVGVVTFVGCLAVPLAGRSQRRRTRADAGLSENQRRTVLLRFRSRTDECLCPTPKP